DPVRAVEFVLRLARQGAAGAVGRRGRTAGGRWAQPAGGVLAVLRRACRRRRAGGAAVHRAGHPEAPGEARGWRSRVVHLSSAAGGWNMSWNVQLELEPLLLERVRRFANTRGWSLEQALGQLVERGLLAAEAETMPRFDQSDAAALREAIQAMEQFADDPGFSLIGRSGLDQDDPGRAEPSVR